MDVRIVAISLGVKMWSNLFSAGTALDSDTDADTGTAISVGAEIGTDTDTEIRTDGSSDTDAYLYGGTAKQISKGLNRRQ